MFRGTKSAKKGRETQKRRTSTQVAHSVFKPSANRFLGQNTFELQEFRSRKSFGTFDRLGWQVLYVAPEQIRENLPTRLLKEKSIWAIPKGHKGFPDVDHNI